MVGASSASPSVPFAGLDLGAVDQLGLLGHGDAEAGEVEVALRVHARHLGGLAADQCAAGELAALGDALDDLRGHFLVELAGGVVVEEEQRLGARHQHVVDAHADQVLAQALYAAAVDAQAQLGADAVGTRHQHRLLVLLRQTDQRAETADTADHLRPLRGLDDLLDVVDQRVTGIDVDAGIPVAEAAAFLH